MRPDEYTNRDLVHRPQVARFEGAKADVQQAIDLSPKPPRLVNNRKVPTYDRLFQRRPCALCNYLKA
jgi:hypothetical protein